MNVWAKNQADEPVYTGKGDYQDRDGMTLTEGVRQDNQCVLALDEAVGRLLQALEASGQLENTLIIFTSHQGYAWGFHGFRHKLGPYDDTIRSPLIFAMPGTSPAGKTCDVPVAGVASAASRSCPGRCTAAT